MILWMNKCLRNMDFEEEDLVISRVILQDRANQWAWLER